MFYRRKSTRGEIITVVTIGGLLIMGVATLVTSFLVKNKNIKLTTKSKASETCAIISVESSPSPVTLGTEFNCRVKVDSSLSQSRTIACGVSVNNGYPQNFCPSDTRYRGWDGSAHVFGCVIPTSAVPQNATVELVGFDFSTSCGPTSGKRFTLTITNYQQPTKVPTQPPPAGCAAGKVNKQGVCDLACCSNNSECNNKPGETCIISNGNCNSGWSCGIPSTPIPGSSASNPPGGSKPPGAAAPPPNPSSTTAPSALCADMASATICSNACTKTCYGQYCCAPGQVTPIPNTPKCSRSNPNTCGAGWQCPSIPEVVPVNSLVNCVPITQTPVPTGKPCTYYLISTGTIKTFSNNESFCDDDLKRCANGNIVVSERCKDVGATCDNNTKSCVFSPTCSKIKDSQCREGVNCGYKCLGNYCCAPGQMTPTPSVAAAVPHQAAAVPAESSGTAVTGNYCPLNNDRAICTWGLPPTCQPCPVGTKCVGTGLNSTACNPSIAIPYDPTIPFNVRVKVTFGTLNGYPELEEWLTGKIKNDNTLLGGVIEALGCSRSNFTIDVWGMTFRTGLIYDNGQDSGFSTNYFEIPPNSNRGATIYNVAADSKDRRFVDDNRVVITSTLECEGKKHNFPMQFKVPSILAAQYTPGDTSTSLWSGGIKELDFLINKYKLELTK